MANDRLYIRCNECGELCFIGKHFGGSWETRSYEDNEIENRLDKFFSKHFITCFNNTSDYSFIAEFDDDFPTNGKFFNIKEDWITKYLAAKK